MEAAHGILPHSFNLLFKSLAGVSTSGTSSHSPRNYDKAGAGESGRKKRRNKESASNSNSRESVKEGKKKLKNEQNK